MHKLLLLLLLVAAGSIVLVSITKQGANFNPLTDASVLTTNYRTPIPTPLGNCTRCDPNNNNKTILCSFANGNLSNCRQHGFCLNEGVCVQSSQCVAWCVPKNFATPGNGKCTRCSNTDRDKTMLCDYVNGKYVNCKPGGRCLDFGSCNQISECIAICSR